MNHLVDSFGRVHTDLRVSVTDRCNFRCTYCMPAGVVTFKPREELLSFEEIVGIVSVAASLGVHRSADWWRAARKKRNSQTRWDAGERRRHR